MSPRGTSAKAVTLLERKEMGLNGTKLGPWDVGTGPHLSSLCFLYDEQFGSGMHTAMLHLAVTSPKPQDQRSTN